MARDDNDSDYVDASPAMMRKVRMTLLAGVIMLGILATILLGNGYETVPEIAGPMQMINIVILVGTAGGVLFAQRKHAASRDIKQRNTWNIVGWAFGEGAALFGGVHYLMVGSSIPYLVGLGMLLASFALVPLQD